MMAASGGEGVTGRAIQQIETKKKSCRLSINSVFSLKEVKVSGQFKVVAQLPSSKLGCKRQRERTRPRGDDERGDTLNDRGSSLT